MPTTAPAPKRARYESSSDESSDSPEDNLYRDIGLDSGFNPEANVPATQPRADIVRSSGERCYTAPP